jgi:MerR family transcriptional regulator/heat shock protein HspR
MFSAKDLERLAQIKAWIDDLGVNLAGVDVMLRMQDQIDRLREEAVRDRVALIERYEAEIRRLKVALLRVQADR